MQNILYVPNYAIFKKFWKIGPTFILKKDSMLYVVVSVFSML